MLRSELREIVNISSTSFANIEGHSLTKEHNLGWEDVDLYLDNNESINMKRMKNLVRWELDGGGPIADIGYDEQQQKRGVQDLLNIRLARHLLHNPSLYGGIVLLAGIKPTHAIEPYNRMHAAKLICIVEKKHEIYWTLRRILETFKEDHKTTRIYRKPLDIIEASINLNKKDPKYWRGFDLDFDTSLTDTRLRGIETLVKTIKSPSFWLRVTATQRPIGKEKTVRAMSDILQFAISNGYHIDDLACGDAFTYRDTASMSTMQIICTRR
jgi:hypothetical protein